MDLELVAEGVGKGAQVIVICAGFWIQSIAAIVAAMSIAVPPQSTRKRSVLRPVLGVSAIAVTVATQVSLLSLELWRDAVMTVRPIACVIILLGGFATFAPLVLLWDVVPRERVGEDKERRF